MKKPEKKEGVSIKVGFYKGWKEGFNQAYDEYEAFLPSEEEIIKLFTEYNQEHKKTSILSPSQIKIKYPIPFDYDLKGLAKATYKRITE